MQASASDCSDDIGQLLEWQSPMYISCWSAFNKMARDDASIIMIADVDKLSAGSSEHILFKEHSTAQVISKCNPHAPLS